MRGHFPASLIVHRGIYIPREPSWLFRWGNLLLFTLLLFSIVIASLTAFNETTSAPVTVSTLFPPVDLRSNRSGIIEQIFVAQGDTVEKGQLLAVLKSKTDLDDITYLKNRISSEDFTDSLQENATLRLDGNVAAAYTNFRKSMFAYHNRRSMSESSIIEAEMVGHLNEQYIIEQNALYSERLFAEDSALMSERLLRYENLQERGLISKNDFEQQKKEYLNQLVNKNVNEKEIGLSRSENKKLSLQKKIISEHNRTTVLLLQNAFIDARDELLMAIENWEENYLIKSPINGRVNLYGTRATLQFVDKDQMVFTIIPVNEQKLLATCNIPSKNAGKLKQGLGANVRLDSYPFKDWGSIKARISTLSEIPDAKGNYMVILEINSMITSHGKKMVFRQSMTGQAEIILNRNTLLAVLFRPFKTLFATND